MKHINFLLIVVILCFVSCGDAKVENVNDIVPDKQDQSNQNILEKSNTNQKHYNEYKFSNITGQFINQKMIQDQVNIQEHDPELEYGNIVPEGLVVFFEHHEEYTFTHIIVRFPKPVKYVKYGIPSKLVQKSNILPKGVFWEGYLSFSSNKEEIVVIGSPVDGTDDIVLRKKTSYLSELALKYNPRNFNEQTISLTARKNYRAVIKYDESEIVMKTDNGLQFTCKCKLPLKKPAKLIVYDNNNDIVYIKTLSMFNSTEFRRYSCDFLVNYGEKAIFSYNLQGMDFRIESVLEPPACTLDDTGNTNDANMFVHDTTRLLSVDQISKNFFLETTWIRRSSLDDPILYQGRRIMETYCTEYYVFDIERNKYTFVDKKVKYIFYPMDDRLESIAETGSEYTPIKWLRDKIICLCKEYETKEVFMDDPNAKETFDYGAEEATSPYYSTKVKEINLSNFRIEYNQYTKLISDNARSLDSITELLEYEKSFRIEQDKPDYSNLKRFENIIITDHGNTKTYSYTELFKQISNDKDHGIKYFEYIGSNIMDNQRYVYFKIEAGNVVGPREDERGIMGKPFVETSKWYLIALNFDTGKINELWSYPTNDKSVKIKPSPWSYFTTCGEGFGDLPITILAADFKDDRNASLIKAFGNSSMNRYHWFTGDSFFVQDIPFVAWHGYIRKGANE